MTLRSALARCGVAAVLGVSGRFALAQPSCEPGWRVLRGGMAEASTYGWGPIVLSIQEFDDGSGPALYAGGHFQMAGGVRARDIARWDGAMWSPVGDEVRGVESMAVFDDGTGANLYAGCQFNGYQIARWDGSSWSMVGEGGPRGRILEMAVYDDGRGPALYVAGLFRESDGIRTHNIARWDGVNWSPVGDVGVGGMVFALAAFDDGSGPALYVGGNFYSADDVSARHIARWDGASWSALGHERFQKTGDFAGLTVFDDGSGPTLYGIAFMFDATGGPWSGGVLRWDGVIWNEVGGFFRGRYFWPEVLHSYDDGRGEALFVGGHFTIIGGEPVSRLARWDGGAWSEFQGGADGSVRAMVTFDDGAGPALFIGGGFETAGGVAANHIAAWGCSPQLCYADCDDNDILDLFDFLCFQNLYGAGDPRADCDGSGVLDMLDFLCFQDGFAAGC